MLTTESSDSEGLKMAKLEKVAHLRKVEQARGHMAADRKAASEEIFAVSFDFEKALPFPKFTTPNKFGKQHIVLPNSTPSCFIELIDLARLRLRLMLSNLSIRKNKSTRIGDRSTGVHQTLTMIKVRHVSVSSNYGTRLRKMKSHTIHGFEYLSSVAPAKMKSKMDVCKHVQANNI
uniref:Uncharacterized protein n=1 Tax=Glossina pallidipes TaxID=7398 RepID=A0A1A9ZAJ9_GLOPL